MPINRRKLSKKQRQEVYDKYHGHCAYCGCVLEYKDMQVDHIESVFTAEYKGEKVNNDIENFNPSCRACNFYKGTQSIEQFRKAITAILLPNLKKNFNYRLAIKYGFVEPKEVRPVRFYFEGMRMEQ